MANDPLRETPSDLEIHSEPRRREEDPTLGVTVEVDRTGRPVNRLVTLGDSITQGFMSGAIFRTELSWPAIVAYELGLRLGTEFRYPVYEPPNGPGGLPLDLERLARAFGSRFGDKLDWHEIVRAALWLRGYMDKVEDYWERGLGSELSTTPTPFHNLAVYGADVVDVQRLTGDVVTKRLALQPNDDALGQIPQHANDLAWQRVLESCRNGGRAGTVLDAAAAMGAEGLVGGAAGPGIETMVVALGSNHALGSVLHLKPQWTPANYLDQSAARRFAAKSNYNVWRPAHFAVEWSSLVTALKRIGARHVIVATIPQVTIAPITRGVKGKVRQRSRYFEHYTRPWINDEDFDAEKDPNITEHDARAIDSAIDAYNEIIIQSVRVARGEGRDWYLLDLGGLLDSLATRRYIEDPSAQPPWWKPYQLPQVLADLTPPPNTRFFRSDPRGRTEGGLFSLDGVHPTTSAAGLIAQEVMRIMHTNAQIQFALPDGTLRSDANVDFARVLAADSLLSRPPTSVSSNLALLGWLDQTIDWVNRILP